MGCDWYDQITVVCRGTVTEKEVDWHKASMPGNYIFKASKFESDERRPASWVGTLDWDDDLEEATEWLVVNVDEELVRHSHNVPGPYEIDEDCRRVTITAKDGLIVISATDGPVKAVRVGPHLFWTRALHPRLPPQSRKVVVTVLLCMRRGATTATATKAKVEEAGAVGTLGALALPALPVEVKEVILGFVRAVHLGPPSA